MTNELQIVTTIPEQEALIADCITVLDALGLSARFDNVQKKAFVKKCMAFGVNPIRDEAHAVPYNVKDATTGKYITRLGVIIDYKVFLSRAERSGCLDGWTVAMSGKVVRKPVEKSKKVKDWNTNTERWEKYIAYVIDKEKTDLTGTITIWRKDWSRPFVSRPLSLVTEMEDTPFWDADPEGMLEKALIREFFQKVFPKDCDLSDNSKEYRVNPADDVVTPAYEVIETPSASSPIDLANLVKEAHKVMDEFGMMSDAREKYREQIASAFKAKDAKVLGAIIEDLIDQRDKAINASKKAKTPVPPEPDPEPVKEDEVYSTPPEILKEDMIKTMNALLTRGGYAPKHACNSIRANLPTVLLPVGDLDWEAAILAADIPENEARAAIDYWQDAIKKVDKKNASKPMPKKSSALTALINQIDQVIRDKNLDIDAPEWSEVKDLMATGTETSLRSALILLQ